MDVKHALRKSSPIRSEPLNQRATQSDPGQAGGATMTKSLEF